MRKGGKHDDPLAGALAHALGQSQDAPAKDCPEAGILAAYFERSLGAAEAAHWEGHFAACARCQAQLAALARSEPAVAAAGETAPGLAWLWNWRWMAPAAAALGVLVIWVALRPGGAPLAPAPTLTAKNEAAQELNRNAQVQPERKAGDAIAPGAPASAARKPGEDSYDLASGKKGTEVSNQVSGITAATRAEPPAQAADKLGAMIAQSKPVAEEPHKEARKVAEGEKAREKAELADEAGRRDAQRGALAKAAGPAEPGARQNVPAAQSVVLEAGAEVQQAQKRQEAEGRAQALVVQTAPPPKGGFAAAKITPAERDARAPALAGRFREGAALIASPNAQVVWAVGPAGLIARSTDRGATWQMQASEVTVELLAGSAPSNTVCWVVGRAGTILRTTDGSKWERIGSPADEDMVWIQAQDAQAAAVRSTSGTTYKTSNGGRTWVRE